jgi:nitrite reductase (NADH) small subunit
MNDWVRVCRVEDARQHGAAVALFRTADDRVFALLDRCPHRGGPLSQGIVTADGVACPLHNWTIGLADGCARAPDVGCTPKFALRVEQGLVHLDAQELRHHAIDPLAA